MPKAPRHTLAGSAELSGIALHTGHAARVVFSPAPSGTGVVLRRLDRSAPPVPALVEHVTQVERRTVLGSGDDGIQTVEHVLAALHACSLDDVEVGVDGPEPPAADGSAAPFVAALDSAGITEHAGTSGTLPLDAPLVVTEGDARYVLSPSPTPRITVTIDFEHQLIGRQSGCWDLDPASVARDLAPARTFGFRDDWDALRARGLALGASADNTIVLTADGLDGGAALRWPDEFARHKALDLIGDLQLAGGRIACDVVAFRPSHAGNLSLARAVRRIIGGTVPPVMGIEDILGVLPHRYPMLLVDRILEVHGRERIVGLKNVTSNEPYFQGHFPDHPIMPGVLIVEAMAQCGGMLLMGAVEEPETKVVYFMSIDGVKFRRPVVPGDQLRFELEMLQFRGKTCRMKGVAYVAGQVAAEAEMMAAVVDK